MNSQVKSQFLKKPINKVIFTNVINPCCFQIHLVEYQKDLFELIDKLNDIYYGLHVSRYNMQIQEAEIGKLCAARFSHDKNWHRGKIVEVSNISNIVKVFYIDYGGCEFVSLEKVKFLDKCFAQWPIQIINAKLHNLKKPENVIWDNSIINYILERVQGKEFEVKTVGMSNDCDVFSLEIMSEISFNNKVNTFNLKKELVKDGFCEYFDEMTLGALKLYETLNKKNC